jgi:hypothetical protein
MTAVFLAVKSAQPWPCSRAFMEYSINRAATCSAGAQSIAMIVAQVVVLRPHRLMHEMGDACPRCGCVPVHRELFLPAVPLLRKLLLAVHTRIVAGVASALV